MLHELQCHLLGLEHHRVEVVPDLGEGGAGVVVIVAAMEHDLGGVKALGPHLRPDLEDGLVVLLVGAPVGGVNEDEIHPRGGELHGMLADDPLVIGLVVAKVRLGPVMSEAQRTRLHDLDQLVGASLGEGLGVVENGI